MNTFSVEEKVNPWWTRLISLLDMKLWTEERIEIQNSVLIEMEMFRQIDLMLSQHGK